MAKVIKHGGHNPDKVYVAGELVYFDENGVAEVTNEAQLAILKEIAQSTGQYTIEDEEATDKVEEADKEDAPKKRGTRKKSEE